MYYLFFYRHMFNSYNNILLNYNLFISSNGLKDILFLRTPKLIISSFSVYPIKLDNIVNVNENLTKDTLSSDINNKLSKKSKNHLNSDLSLESKKTKVKVTKKGRRSTSIDNETKFGHKKQEIINDDNFNLDLVKKPKSKKKSKTKSSGLIQNFSLNHLDQEDNDEQSKEKKIYINKPLTIKDLALKLSMPPAEIIMNLFLKGISVTINEVIDISIATEIAHSYEFEVLESIENYSEKNIVTQEALSVSNIEDLSVDLFHRPPIITIFGHVDHGKTTLLDAILNTTLVERESGGITQAINGYEIEYSYSDKLYRLMIIDTPGHNAFVSMRVRGIKITDIALLIVAADDGLKTQTIECINSILSNNLPYIVVINKIDKPKIDIQKLKEQLAIYGIVDKQWGGEALIVEISALYNQNLDILLSSICEMYESLNLRAKIEQNAEGIVLEASIDSKKGVIANLVIQNGTLKIGDYCIIENMYCKVKSLTNCSGFFISNALPSSIVQMLGFSSTPSAGSRFHCVSTEKEAKLYILQNFNHDNLYDDKLQNSLLNSRITFYNNSQNINVKNINLILKADTQGSIEAILNAFYQISQQKVQLNVLVASAGNFTNSDFDLAKTSNAIILGFNIPISSKMDQLIKKSNILVRTFNIIYDLLDFTKEQMLNLIDPEYEPVFIGSALVQTVFNVNKGVVAGCLVNTGKLQKNSHIHILRNNNIIHKSLLSSLKRIKDDVNDVNVGNECGVMCIDFNLWKKDDIIEAYHLIEKNKIL